MATIAVICGLSSTMTCTSGTYEIKPVADLQASPLSECNKLDEFRSYYPVTEKLNYSSNSACQPGRLICSLDRFGLYRWTPIADMAPFTPSDLGAETCNGKDDDCNGMVDDVPDLGGGCNNGQVGYCNLTGLWQCNKSTGKLDCKTTPLSRAKDDNYHNYPYYDQDGKSGWNWNCENDIEPIFCLQSKLINGVISSTSASSSLICNTTMSGLFNNILPSPKSDPLCGAANATMWVALNISNPSTANKSDCGKSDIFVRCTGTGNAVSSSDAVVVVCK